MNPMNQQPMNRIIFHDNRFIFVYVHQSFQTIFMIFTIPLQSLPLLLQLANQECNIGAYGVLHHLSPSLHLFVGLKGVCQCDDGVPN